MSPSQKKARNKKVKNLKQHLNPTDPTNKRVELLFEIGCEELRAGMLPQAVEDLRSLLNTHLTAENLTEGVSLDTFGGPRRLTASVRGLIAKQSDVVSDVTGPPKSVAYDNTGAPTRAAVSFAEKQGVSLHELFFVQTPKGEYVAAKVTRRGRGAADLLTEILPRVIHDLSWPRTMTWTGLEGARFIRPVRWLVAVLDGKPLKFSFGGVATATSSPEHSFLGASSIRVRDFAEYEKKLRVNGVIVRPAERREKITRDLAAHSRHGSIKVHEDAHLLDLVTYLNEFPSVLEGCFDPSFLELPDEILVTVMRGHQKYFAVEKQGGELAPQFLAVINLPKDPKGLVRAGHERVLRARFADARFFWASDQKSTLAEILPKLDKITYESRLGSYDAKGERMRDIARWLAKEWFDRGNVQSHVADADRAAELSKCDLATEMVREFPELQGIVGGLYAKAQAEPEQVADAIYDHYRPVGLDDPIPRNLTGCSVSLADKFDSVVGCFAVGVVPKGSSDPYALRRAALGIVKIILERKLPLSLKDGIAAAAKALHTHPPKKTLPPETEKQILDFLHDRARFVFREKSGYAYDEINAVFGPGADDLVDAEKRLRALKAIRKRHFEPLAGFFKRIRKILEKANASDRGHDLRSDLLKDPAEKALHAALLAAAPKISAAKASKEYQQAFETIATLRPQVDAFFDTVMVMAEEEDLRRNRLALLNKLKAEVSAIAYLEEMGGEDAR